MVSIVMPAYNAEKTIKASIQSIIEQTINDWELIVIDDGSIDGTATILSGLADSDSRIRFLQNRTNQGVSYTRNRAIKLAQGEWIAFLDSDDLWKPQKLEKQLSLIEKYPDIVICYTASSFIDEDDHNYDYILEAEERVDYNMLLRKNLLSCSSVMIRTEVMKKIQMPNDRMHEDYYVWLTVIQNHGTAYGINEPLLVYRLSANSKSSNRLKSAKMLYNSYRAVGYNPIIANIFVLRYAVHSLHKRRCIYHHIPY